MPSPPVRRHHRCWHVLTQMHLFMGGRWYTVAIRFWGTSPGTSKNNMKSPDRIWYDSVSYVRPPLYVTCDDCGCFSKSCVKVWWINRCVFYLNESAKWVGTTDYITYAAPKNPTPSRCWAMKTGFWSAEHTTDWRFSRHPLSPSSLFGLSLPPRLCRKLKDNLLWTAERVTTCIQQGEIVAKIFSPRNPRNDCLSSTKCQPFWLFLLKRHIVM